MLKIEFYGFGFLVSQGYTTNNIQPEIPKPKNSIFNIYGFLTFRVKVVVICNRKPKNSQPQNSIFGIFGSQLVWLPCNPTNPKTQS